MIRSIVCASLVTLGLATLAIAQDPAVQQAGPEKNEFVLSVFDIRDLLTEVRDFPAPTLGLRKRATVGSKGATPTVRGETRILQIRMEVRTLEGVTWPEGSSLRATNGQLVVRNTTAATALIRSWLESRRSEMGRLISIETRFLAVPSDVVKGYPRGLHIVSDQRAQAILALAGSKQQATVLSAPRLTTFDGQLANIVVAQQTSYIARFDVRAVQGAVVADPVVEQLTTGLAMEVRASARGDGWVDVDLDVQQADLLKPMAVAQTRFGAVQVPDVVAQRLRTRGSLPKGAWAMLTGLTEVTPEGAAGKPVIVLAKITPLKRD